MNRILFIGACDKSDLMLYISKILKTGCYKVLLIDATSSQIYKYAVSSISMMELSEHDGFDIATGLVEPALIERYDYVLIDTDDKALMKHYSGYGPEACVLVTNYEKRTIALNQMLLEHFFQEYTNETAELFKVIYHVDCHVDEAYIDSTLDAYPITWLEPTFMIYEDEYDYAVKLSNQFKNKVEIKRLSRKYRKLILELISRVSDIPNKPLRKAMKYAVRGKMS